MAKSESLLVRLLNTPDLATIVPRLQPEVLHRVLQTCGLEDCAEFVALATPEQLTRILDARVIDRGERVCLGLPTSRRGGRPRKAKTGTPELSGDQPDRGADMA